MSEQRRAARAGLRLPCAVDDPTTRGETENLSHLGALLALPIKPAAGEALALTLGLGDRALTVEAQVRHTRGGVGVEFLGEDRERVRAYVAEHANERRCGERRALRLLVWMALDDEGEMAVFTGDLSYGGLFLATRSPPLLGQRLTLTVVDETNETLMTLQGEVVRCATHGVGVRFVEVDAATRAKLVRMLAA